MSWRSAIRKKTELLTNGTCLTKENRKEKRSGEILQIKIGGEGRKREFWQISRYSVTEKRKQD